jgi:hypothetical protein
VRIQIAVPEANVTKPVLDGALEAVTRLNEQLIKSGASPTSAQLIESGARWQPEKPGDEHFDHGALMAERGHGDCDDWAPLHAASLRVTGQDPEAKAIVRKSGPKRWHAIVQRSDGSIDDPSLAAGMPGPKVVGVRGAWVPVMRERLHGVGGTYVATPHLALRPVADRQGQLEAWQARADLPWHWQQGHSASDVAMASLHQSELPDQAVVGAVRGAFRLGLASGGADPENLRRLSAIADACEGCPWEELAEAYGPEHATAAGAIVGSFFGKAFKKLGKGLKGGLKFVTHNPLAKIATSFVPGAGLATMAFNAASPALKKAVMRKQHERPDQRTPLEVSQRAPVSSPAGGAGCPAWLPYPYPLPYPVPAWTPPASTPRATRTTHAPGTAWPPR